MNKEAEEYIPQEPVLSFYNTFLNNPKRFVMKANYNLDASSKLSGITYEILDKNKNIKFEISRVMRLSTFSFIKSNNISWMTDEDCRWIIDKLCNYSGERSGKLQQIRRQKLMKVYCEGNNNDTIHHEDKSD